MHVYISNLVICLLISHQVSFYNNIYILLDIVRFFGTPTCMRMHADVQIHPHINLLDSTCALMCKIVCYICANLHANTYMCT